MVLRWRRRRLIMPRHRRFIFIHLFPVTTTWEHGHLLVLGCSIGLYHHVVFWLLCSSFIYSYIQLPHFPSPPYTITTHAFMTALIYTILPKKFLCRSFISSKLCGVASARFLEVTG
ncbi:hypothetical protein BDZ89DRAFT_360148 [Hymenopellis radicata]|nr:hypothetical protein BDZ89DRAFT_360148 [Hymenopellis radicata]